MSKEYFEDTRFLIYVCYFQSLTYQISSEAKSYCFDKENITVVIPSNTVDAENACEATITPKSHSKHRKDAMSKIYEFRPSRVNTKNRMMFVFALFNQHTYDYSNMTLMYRADEDSDFVCVDHMKDPKPTWLFHRNTCYLFLNHFCQVYVKLQIRLILDWLFCCGTQPPLIPVDCLLFYKHVGNNLKLRLTFGCYHEKCYNSHRNVTEVCF